MKLLVVITSYRAARLTIECLESLEPEIAAIPGAKVGICDNGNEDDTAAQLHAVIAERGWGDWAYVKTVMPNRGFAGGNNVILRDALLGPDVPDFFLLLNADTIVHPGALVSLLQVAETRPDVGIFGPRLENPDGSPQVSCFRYGSPISEMLAAARTGPLTKLFANYEVPMRPISDTPIEPQWASFACALIRKEVMLDVGVLDEGYFLYYDDVDYCRSARNAGWGVLYWPAARVVHLEGQSNPVVDLKRRMKRRPDYWFISRSWYFIKFYGRAGLFAANFLWYVGRAIALLRETFGKKAPHTCEKEWLDNWKGFTISVEPRTLIGTVRSK
jgi:GT2 family glycosyltransferase